VVLRFYPLEKNVYPLSLEESLESPYNLRVSDIEAHADALLEFHADFADFFRSATRNVAPHALDNLQGQLVCEARRNMSQMSSQVVERNPQALSNFISTSPWEDAPLLEAIGQHAARLLSAFATGTAPALILDESGIAKQGKASVGVTRQYCGALGKVDNCQVGVYLAYCTDQEATLIDRRLFVPQRWIDDPARCAQAGIPPQAEVFRTKAQLGWEMIQAARAQDLAFSFVGMDAHYGEQPWLLSRLEDEGMTYIADIPATTRVYVDAPTRGRAAAPRKLRPKTDPTARPGRRPGASSTAGHQRAHPLADPLRARYPARPAVDPLCGGVRLASGGSTAGPTRLADYTPGIGWLGDQIPLLQCRHLFAPGTGVRTSTPLLGRAGPAR
jgi:hypothetical protein